MSKQYSPVASFPSSSNPTKTYTVSEDENGELSCDCPAWVFKKGTARTCKHILEVAQLRRSGRPSPSSPPDAKVQSFASAGQGGRPSSERGGSLQTLLKRLERNEGKGDR